MAMMRSLRDRMHVVLWGLLILFILSMTVGGLVGGANIIDQLLGRISPVEAIGVVNGDIIPPNQFNQAVSARLESFRTQGREVTDQILESIREDIWSTFVEEKLLEQAIAELNISVTEEEILYHLENNPPADIQRFFMVGNQFDEEAYRNALNTPGSVDWTPIETWMRDYYIPRFKLQQTLNLSAVVTDEDIHDEFIKRNVEYTINALHIPTAAVQDEVIEPSDDDLLLDYNLRKEDFKQEERRILSYVRWEKSPTKSDTLRIFNEALSIKNSAQKGENFNYLANLYSQDPGNQVNPDSGRGGDLGWFGKGQMVPPFEDAAFNAKTGQIVGPVLSPFGYHIIKIDSSKIDKKERKIRASHILLKIEIGQNTKTELRRKSTLFSYDAQGEGFSAAVDTHKVSIHLISSVGEKDIFLPEIGTFRSAVRFAYNNEIGSISDPLENDNFFAVFSLDSIHEEGILPFETVKEQIYSKVLKEKQRNAVEMLAYEYRGQLDGGAVFSDLLKENEKLELVSLDSKKLNSSFKSLGKSNHLVGALLDAKEGDLLGPIPTYRGFGLVLLMSVGEFDSTEWKVQKDNIHLDLMRRKQNQTYQSWMAERREEADIVDNRKYHF